MFSWNWWVRRLDQRSLRDVLPCASLRPNSAFAPSTWLFVESAAQAGTASAQGDGSPAFHAQFLITFHYCVPQAQRFRFPPIAFRQLLALGPDIAGGAEVPPMSLGCTDYSAPWRTVRRWFGDEVLGVLAAL